MCCSGTRVKKTKKTLRCACVSLKYVCMRKRKEIEKGRIQYVSERVQVGKLP